MLPSHLSAAIVGISILILIKNKLTCIQDCKQWILPAIFAWLQQTGNIDAMEMLRTFNCGVGMVLVVKSSDANRILNELKHTQVWLIGSVLQKTSQGKFGF